ncbi:hypothetical protein N7468_005499 [Penicillium chermesinum]|uniref:Benzoate 4-monooxygenase n=1 Tax=Penicillium chermesinum TaxID=63820 RepID=A0A9W9P1Z1_9EURO|nr:uncharacterized protein N7468_005499 [Penicillium chermesinum]KAJ5232543.1 hypothetical protein N7468_005499 [Penicillium chermesinum]
MAISSLIIGYLVSPWILTTIPLWLVLYYIVPYFTTFSSLAGVPGPFLAKFSNLWVAFGARRGKKFEIVDKAHRKYGNVVRIGYNHVSIADERGLNVVYGHGNGFLKDHYYEAFVAKTPGMFNVRDRAEHTRKRKIIAHAFSPRSVAEFEPHMTANLERWVKQLDLIAAKAPPAEKYSKFNAMPWFSYLAFDIIGDLAFGSPFGMVNKGKDEAESQLVLNRRGEISSTLGLLPALRPIARYLPDPFFSKGVAAVENLTGIAIAAVAARLDAVGKDDAAERNDILARLIQARDAKGEPMGREELVAEALTQLIAGSDTISNTACACFYWILAGERANPGQIIPRLQKELDHSIGTTSDIAAYSQVRDLPFLRRCIDEAMRLHSTSALGLPRLVAEGPDVEFDGYYFPLGPFSPFRHIQFTTWLRYGRWLSLTPRQKTCFNPFSYGPRACVGQNVAIMELQLIIGTLFHRYDFCLFQQKMESHEGFSKKPRECFAGIQRRGIV